MGYIIDVAIPCLMFIYPITIVLIALSVLPNSLTKRSVYRATVITAVLFSIPDFLATIDYNIISLELLQAIRDKIPLADAHMGWILPSVVVFGLANIVLKNNGKISKKQ